jgi:hypothetical protein
VGDNERREVRQAKLNSDESGRLASLISDSQLEIQVHDQELVFKIDNGFSVNVPITDIND